MTMMIFSRLSTSFLSIVCLVLGSSLAHAALPQNATTYIVGGSEEDGFDAVGALVVDNGESFCTGTLVSDRVVVTAAHCLVDEDEDAELGFFIGPDTNEPSGGRVIAVESFHLHPDYDDFELDNDIAVVRLAESVTGVSPIPLLQESMTDEWVGRDLVFVGYGITGSGEGGYGRKMSVTIPISEVHPMSFRYDHDSKNTCSGDSGGPALAQVEGQPVLVGVTSWGDLDCAEFGVNVRVDPYIDFIHAVSEGNGDSPGGAGAEDGPTMTDPEEDFCEEAGWYGDGICDHDCPRPDEDCEDASMGDDMVDESDIDDAQSEIDDADIGDDASTKDDACAEEGLYGDGTCDPDCPRPDEDCADESEASTSVETGDTLPSQEHELVDGDDSESEAPCETESGMTATADEAGCSGGGADPSLLLCALMALIFVMRRRPVVQV